MEIAANLFIAGADRTHHDSLFEVINLEALAAYQPSWEKVPQSQKRAIFIKASELLNTPKYADRMKMCMAQETAATANWQGFSQISAHRYLLDIASQATQIKGETIESEKPDCRLFIVQRRAAGVVLGIAPWNAPVQLAIRAVGYALIAGNTVLVKASEYSPASQRIVMDLMLEAGLPPKAMSFLVFSRKSAADLTSRIIARDEVRRVSFTGSHVVGRIIAGQCGQHSKQCILELGGKAPVIVSKHALENLESAAWGVVYGALIHSGQVCMSTERVLVQKDVYERFEQLVSQRVATIKTGDVTASAQMGALFTPASAQNVVTQIQEAVQNGAKMFVGQTSKQAGGEYNTLVQPTVLGDVRQDMTIWHKELFGPVIAMTPFGTMDEAIALANDSKYSLSAGIWTTNLEEAMTYAPQIRAASVQAGLGGASGYGRFNIDAFTDLRTIAFHAQGATFPTFAM
ncbi:MAG: hypothetical protein CYPHOPRED_000982 [Cyphobasidiales sp. Tagirdzhanova-0007]|nr:MAG: hypothetical protein CYPHOPRED_000982 [Cyphobasidiales sp. Tagirdzhanova-0007]